MARTDPQVNLRIPADLKGRLEKAATDSGRSLTAEIVARLEATFSEEAIKSLSSELEDDISKQTEVVQGLASQIEKLQVIVRTLIREAQSVDAVIDRAESTPAVKRIRRTSPKNS